MPSPGLPARACMLRTLVATCAGVALLAACSHGGTSPTQSAPASSDVSASAARATHVLTIGSVDVQRAGDKGAVSLANRREVLATAQRYVDNAIVAPLVTGKLGRGYPGVFAAGIRPAATGPDVGTLTDLAVGKTATLSETSTPVALSALADGSGTLLYLSAKFSVAVHATRSGGSLTISRNVELTFERVGSAWLVTAYRVGVKRSAPARTPTTPKRRARPTPSASRPSTTRP